MAQPSNRTTMLGLLARQNALATECWWRWYEYEAASEKDKPAIEKEIEALAGEIDKLETTIFSSRPATQCWGADRPVKSRILPIRPAVLTRISLQELTPPTAGSLAENNLPSAHNGMRSRRAVRLIRTQPHTRIRRESKRR